MQDDEMLLADAGTQIETTPVETSPAPSPTPAPEAPAKPESVRDSVRAAFDKLSGGDEPGEPGKTSGQPRDPGGRFASKPKDGEPAAPLAKPDAVNKPVDIKPAPAAPSGPPPGWSVQSKATWDQLPDHIRADIAKREGEVAQGLAALRDYKNLKPYAEMAQKSGTTIADALKRYTDHEALVRRDPAQGLMNIAKNIGLSQAQAAQLFSQIGQALGARPTPGHQSNGGQPSTSGSHQDDPLAEVIGPLIERAIGPMAQKFSAFETHLSRQREADQNARAQSVTEAIEKFAADPRHRYMPELEETISRLFETGMVERTANPVEDLAKAYEMAAQLHPEVREAHINERLATKAAEAKAKAAAAQRAAVSLNGHPAGGAAAPSRPGPGTSVRDSVRAAIQQLSAQV
jgi:hypothetical protein